MDRRLVICTGPACRLRGSRAMARAIHKRMVGQTEWQLIRSSCLNLCPKGPIVVCYPEGQWYVMVRRKEITEIVTSRVSGQTALSPSPQVVFRLNAEDGEPPRDTSH